jgi:hypothetical protein
MHPSYRDLVIDVISSDAELQWEFLEHTNLSGIKIALSTAGGRFGEREMPLLTTEKSKRILIETCKRIAMQEEIENTIEILEVAVSMRDGTHDEFKEEVTRTVWQALKDRMEKNENREMVYLHRYIKKIASIHERMRGYDLPGLDVTSEWDEAIEEAIECNRGEYLIDGDVLSRYAELTRYLSVFSAEEMRKEERVGKRKELTKIIEDVVDWEINSETSATTAKEYTEEAERLEEISSSMATIANATKETEFEIMAREIEGKAEWYREYYESEGENGEDEEGWWSGGKGEDEGIIDKIFEDI